jgi:hypothetical protein
LAVNSLLKKVASAAEARRKCPLRVKNEAKKRSLHGVNEHFELNFDDASTSAVVFQRAVKERKVVFGETIDPIRRNNVFKALIVQGESVYY